MRTPRSNADKPSQPLRDETAREDADRNHDLPPEQCVRPIDDGVSPDPAPAAARQAQPAEPRHVRRRAERDAKKQARKKKPHVSPVNAADQRSAEEELGRATVAYLNALWQTTRATRPVAPKLSACESLTLNGLVVVRGEGAARDDEMYGIVRVRHARLCRSLLNGPPIMMLDNVVYDALPIVYRDPFEELRASGLTGAHASELTLVLTCCYYAHAYAKPVADGGLAPDQHVALLRHLREHDDEWKYPMDTPELSMLAQRILIYVLWVAKSEYSDPEAILEVMRRVIANGRVLELMDPRDGAV